MSYCTITQAKALIGAEISQELLDEAQQTIHNYTWYRWETTSATDTFSSKDFRTFLGHGKLIRSLPSDDASILLPRTELSLFLKMPVITVTSIKIDDTALVEDTDYEIRKEIGEVRLTSFAFLGSSSLTGVGDIEAIYTYGWGSSHEAFKIVQGAEARIALLLKSNPLLLETIELQGDRVNYRGALERILNQVPKSFNAKAILR